MPQAWGFEPERQDIDAVERRVSVGQLPRCMATTPLPTFGLTRAAALLGRRVAIAFAISSSGCPSHFLGHPVDRAAWALRGARTASCAIVVIELELLAGSELDDRVVGAGPVAVVALEAVAVDWLPHRAATASRSIDPG